MRLPATMVTGAVPRTSAALRAELAVEREAAREHPLFALLESAREARVFVEHHAFEVWCDTSLLKSLQRELTCLDVPWVPRGDALARRLVNELVLIEESDSLHGGGYASRFEIYRAAMDECGADGSRLDAFVARIRRGESVSSALALADVPSSARRCVLQAFETIESRSLPRIVGAFTLGHDVFAPDALRAVVTRLQLSEGAGFDALNEYLDRHAVLERERAGPRASRLLDAACADDERAFEEAARGARGMLRARVACWTEISTGLRSGADTRASFPRASANG